jgi:hypothetical protein
MDGVAMGSPLSPVIAEFFMEDFEKKSKEHSTHKPICWFRYVMILSWPRNTDRISEPLQWTPQQDTVYNGKRRRSPSIPGH